jgi:hypothetical protein
MSNKYRGGVQVDSTGVSDVVFLYDSSTGAPKTGIAYSSVTIYYYRQGASSTSQLTMSSLASLDAAHTGGGWAELDATNMKGQYRVDWADAMFAAGADWVTVKIVATGCKEVEITFRIDVLNVDSSGQVKLGSTAANAITATSINTSAFTAAKFDTAALTADKFADNFLTANKINTAALTTAKFAADFLDSTLIADDAIGVDQVAAGALGADSFTTQLINAIADGLLARTLGTESYAAAGATPTVGQWCWEMLQRNFDFSITGTTLTVYQKNGSTPAMTFTLNNASAPTSVHRAS